MEAMCKTNEEQTLDAYFLNARFVLIALVVAANVMEPFAAADSRLGGLYLLIYTFHMPMFAFVTGYFSSRFRLDAHGAAALRTIVYQYALFQTIYSAADVWLFHAPGVKHSFFIPYSLLWFLWSHVCWKAMFALFRRLSHPLTAAVLLGLAAGLLPLPGLWASVSRTLVFFPFFLAGTRFPYRLRWETLVRAIRPWAMAAAVILLIWTLSVAVWRPDVRWFYASLTYRELGSPPALGVLWRLAVYGAQAAASLVFIGLVPVAWTTLAERGQRTLYVYLFQGLIIKGAFAIGALALVRSPLDAALLGAAALAMVWALSDARFRRRLQPWIEPAVPWPPILRAKKAGP